jgi:hypothetical protein
LRIWDLNQSLKVGASAKKEIESCIYHPRSWGENFLNNLRPVPIVL